MNSKYVILFLDTSKGDGNQYVKYAIPGVVLTTRLIEDARRFDSMTEAEIYAIEGNLRRYAIEPVKVQMVPTMVETVYPSESVDYGREDLERYDMGGES